MIFPSIFDRYIPIETIMMVISRTPIDRLSSSIALNSLPSPLSSLSLFLREKTKQKQKERKKERKNTSLKSPFRRRERRERKGFYLGRTPPCKAWIQTTFPYRPSSTQPSQISLQPKSVSAVWGCSVSMRSS